MSKTCSGLKKAGDMLPIPEKKSCIDSKSVGSPFSGVKAQRQEEKKVAKQQDQDVKLMKLARATLENSYAPVTGRKAGAALLTSTHNTVFTGCLVENREQSATICAERSALAKAVSEGFKDFSTIAVAFNPPDDESGLLYPCGTCRQSLSEFSANMRVLLQQGDGSIVVLDSLSTILPMDQTSAINKHINPHPCRK